MSVGRIQLGKPDPKICELKHLYTMFPHRGYRLRDHVHRDVDRCFAALSLLRDAIQQTRFADVSRMSVDLTQRFKWDSRRPTLHKLRLDGRVTATAHDQDFDISRSTTVYFTMFISIGPMGFKFKLNPKCPHLSEMERKRWNILGEFSSRYVEKFLDMIDTNVNAFLNKMSEEASEQLESAVATEKRNRFCDSLRSRFPDVTIKSDGTFFELPADTSRHSMGFSLTNTTDCMHDNDEEPMFNISRIGGTFTVDEIMAFIEIVRCTPRIVAERIVNQTE